MLINNKGAAVLAGRDASALIRLTLDLTPEVIILDMAGSDVQIGELAKRAGVSIDTVRLYERRGLLPRAARSEGGFRLFAPEAIGQIKFIKEAQGIGLSLDEIKELAIGLGLKEISNKIS